MLVFFGVYLVLFGYCLGQTLSTCFWCRFLQSYPSHYTVFPLEENESIRIDGFLNDTAWEHVEFTNTSFKDIAISLYNSTSDGYVIPQNHSTMVKVRYDSTYLYIGAILYEPWVYGSATGHNTDPVPYKDHDFEVFIDFSGTNYYYKEFEINVLNATYDVLWHKTQPIPCNSSCNSKYSNLNSNDWCQHTSYPGNGINGNWTMYGPEKGLQTATQFELLASNQSVPICTYPCYGCPQDTPSFYLKKKKTNKLRLTILYLHTYIKQRCMDTLEFYWDC
ncbi:hypothetical protein RFI_30963 [Reticulomyxa filosa]|uniref:Uncharacterized protein n=1 Tax=Reticulomyxa filosa TaxID=46433 RepID=X6LYM0_RETFI|nr:hypothetical protein RFI_30963 [Reticulomyxa filosa]|eukprot:ETO06431.1 hypothetical protein RFI_30963 [Reticulomyxa filosa]